MVRYELKRMINHQYMGIKLAQVVAVKADHSELRQFATNLETRETAEMRIMQEWLRLWHKITFAPTLSADFKEHLAELSTHRGLSFDLEALQMLIEYERGEIYQIQSVFYRPCNQKLRDLARVIIAADRADITKLRAWRTAWADDRDDDDDDDDDDD